MGDNVYSVELLHQGKYESWDFKSEEERNDFFEAVKEKFAGKEISHENEEVEDNQIVQLSATSLHMEQEGVKQTVPYVWYDAPVFEGMLEFINKRYGKRD